MFGKGKRVGPRVRCHGQGDGKMGAVILPGGMLCTYYIIISLFINIMYLETQNTYILSCDIIKGHN